MLAASRPARLTEDASKCCFSTWLRRSHVVRHTPDHDLPGAVVEAVVVAPVGDQCGVFPVQAFCLFALWQGGKINLHLSESSQKVDPRNFGLLPAADITIRTSKGIWSAKAFFFFSLLIRSKQLVAAGEGSETDEVKHFLPLPGPNKSLGLQVLLLVSIKKKIG